MPGLPLPMPMLSHPSPSMNYSNPSSHHTQHPKQHQFNPYSDNGGTILAVAGKDFCVIAGDTRQTEGFNIQTRYAPKVFRLYVFDSSYNYYLALTLATITGV